MTVLRVACMQLAPSVSDVPGNLARAGAAIDQAIAAGAGLVVLPELVTSGYVFASKDEVARAAIALRSPVLADWQARLAESGAVLVAGVPLRDGGTVSNAAVVLDADGLRAVYRKVHLWDEEKRWFVAGDEPPPVVDTAFGRLGVMICYDLEFPEMARGLLVAGADIVAVPTNWPLSPRPDSERPPEMTDAMSTARLSRLAIACCDRSGHERGVDWTGGSCVVSADGWLLGERPARDVGAVVADVDLDAARDKALTPRNDVRADRRPDVYARMLGYRPPDSV